MEVPNLENNLHTKNERKEAYFDHITSRINNYWINVVHVSLPSFLPSLFSFVLKINLSQKGATPLQNKKNANATKNQAISASSQ
jgi:hypothetical protein